MKISVALVGAGYWGQKLLPKFMSAPDCSVKTVCDLSAALRDNAKQKFPAVATTDSYHDVLKDSAIDAVLLVTPPASHFPLAQKALEAGKHVWIEKPLALHVEEGRRLV